MKRYAIANWKMNLPPEGISRYLDAMEPVAKNGSVVIAPPFPYLREVAARVPTAGQNCAEQKSGAFTGEVAPSMLRDCGARYVIIGHSERRTIYGETDERIARKLSVAFEQGLVPVLCIGEDAAVREAGRAAVHVANQIAAVSDAGIRGDVIVAYEPIWAIGTGRNATGAMVSIMVSVIREAMLRSWPADVARHVPILYGGSVTPDNISDIGSNGRVAGYLVGGASLDAGKFAAICGGLERLRPA